MPHLPLASERRRTTDPSTKTTTPVFNDTFNSILSALNAQIQGFNPLDPNQILNQLSASSPFVNTLASSLSGAFQPFVSQQLNEVSDLFRQSGNAGALSGTGGPNRLTQVAIPQALAGINQQFGGQLSGLIAQLFGDLIGANEAQQQGQLGLISSLNNALRSVPTGQTTTTTGGSVFEQLFGGSGGAGGGGSGGSRSGFSRGGGFGRAGQFSPETLRVRALNTRQPNSALFGLPPF